MLIYILLNRRLLAMLAPRNARGRRGSGEKKDDGRKKREREKREETKIDRDGK